MTESTATAGQTVGPFFHAICFDGDCRLVEHTHPHAIQLHGVVYDGAGNGVPDALVELWQANPDGAAVRAPGSLRRTGVFTGWGRSATDSGGHYRFTTVTPGSTTGRPAYFALAIFARGLLDRLFTRAYLPQGIAAGDPLLSAVDAARRETLICRPDPAGYRFDVRLQGPGETVFLDYRDDPS
jgi:protocatechuate 3,4-dioxygenase, alpha subunit